MGGGGLPSVRKAKIGGEVKNPQKQRKMIFERSLIRWLMMKTADTKAMLPLLARSQVSMVRLHSFILTTTHPSTPSDGFLSHQTY